MTWYHFRCNNVGVFRTQYYSVVSKVKRAWNNLNVKVKAVKTE